MKATKNKHKHVHVLIVENDKISRTIAEALLKDHFSIESISSPYEALQALETKKYDIILMNIHPGDNDAIAVTKHIRENPRHEGIKIIAVTADYDQEESSIIGQGFDNLFTKPVVKEDIIQAIDATYQSTPIFNPAFRNTGLGPATA